MVKKIILRMLATVAMALAIATAPVYAQDPIKWSVKSDATKKPVKPGDKITARVTAQIDSAWHLYSITQPPGGPITTTISVPAGQPFKLAGKIGAPKPQVAHDPNFEMDTEYYEGSATFTLPLKVADDAKEGKARLQVTAFFQACNDSLCIPPKTVKLDLPIEIAAEEKPADETAATGATIDIPPDSASTTSSPATDSGSAGVTEPNAPATSPNDSAIPAQPEIVGGGITANQSFGSVLWLAITFGALSLLTPCVFPMIPVTVSYFTNHAAKSRSGAVRHALIYSLGIILTFTALGMVLALVAGATGINKLATNPWVNLLITAIFFGFALNLLGTFQIQVPSSILTKLDKASGSGQILGSLLMGFTFTLTSFTCTVPFVGSVLVLASQGEWKWPLLGMLAFSTVFALPFFILALLPQLMAQLPKSGGWLNSVKVAMGFLEIAAAMKFLSNADIVWDWGIFTREVVIAVWLAVMLLLALYLLGKFRLSHDSPLQSIGTVRLVSALICLAMGFYLLTGLFGKRLGGLEALLPPASEEAATLAGSSANANGELSWMLNDYEGALAKAKSENKLVLIDFTGYTCTNCRWMESNMFPKQEVKNAMQEFVRVRLYTDREGEPYESHQKLQQEKFNTVALPLYAVVDGKGNAIAGFGGLTRNVEEFVSFLRRGQEKGLASLRASLK